MQKLEMLIKTVDAHYDSVHQIQCFYLSCSLVNIARGTCNLMIANEKSNFQNKITIKYERAIMSGSIRIKDNYFDTLQNQLRIKNYNFITIFCCITLFYIVNKYGFTILYIYEYLIISINFFNKLLFWFIHLFNLL